MHTCTLAYMHVCARAITRKYLHIYINIYPRTTICIDTSTKAYFKLFMYNLGEITAGALDGTCPLERENAFWAHRYCACLCGGVYMYTIHSARTRGQGRTCKHTNTQACERVHSLWMCVRHGCVLSHVHMRVHITWKTATLHVPVHTRILKCA